MLVAGFLWVMWVGMMVRCMMMVGDVFPCGVSDREANPGVSRCLPWRCGVWHTIGGVFLKNRLLANLRSLGRYRSRVRPGEVWAVHSADWDTTEVA